MDFMFMSLINTLYVLWDLFSSVGAYIFIGIILWLMIISPIVNLFTDKKNRKYWLSYILLLVFGFIIGPIGFMYIFFLLDRSMIGIVISSCFYLLGIKVIDKLGGTKPE